MRFYTRCRRNRDCRVGKTCSFSSLATFTHPFVPWHLELRAVAEPFPLLLVTCDWPCSLSYVLCSHLFSAGVLTITCHETLLFVACKWCVPDVALGAVDTGFECELLPRLSLSTLFVARCMSWIAERVVRLPRKSQGLRVRTAAIISIFCAS